MRLDKVQVTNFRCIEDSTEFAVQDVTCLVGKNESGKTTILQALWGLNPHDPQKAAYDYIRDYPRKHLSDYEPIHATSPATVVTSKWTLSNPDVTKVETKLGKDSLKSREIAVTSGYRQNFWTVPVEEAKVINHLINQAKCTDEERSALLPFTSLPKLHAHILGLGASASETLKSLLTAIGTLREKRAALAVIDALTLPKFLYFSNYDRMSGDVSVDKLRTDLAASTVSPGDRVFLDFLKFAGTSVDELANTTQFEHLTARVEAASIKVTNQIFQYWSQNKHLKVKFTIDAARPGDPPPYNAGTIMRARVYNQLHDMTVPFSDRSAGFIWFFSFLVNFSQVKKEHGNVIILLDEPGLNLHGRAQGDLLRYFDEQLRPSHQVIYTTHSPFMVPADRLECVRTVEDVVEEKGPYDFIAHGTKVGGDILSTDRDTLFPLQAALGYEITQSLFIGEHTLLVEGPSDILYLKAVSNELRKRNHESLDRRWVVCPTNGIDKVAAFLSLFGGNKLHVAILLDFAKGQKAKVDQIKQSKLLQAGHVFKVTDFVSQAEGDVEDLLGADTYIDIVNSAFGLSSTQSLSPAAIVGLVPNTPRLVLKVEAAFKIMPPQAPEFDHYAPASWLIENPSVLSGNTAALNSALERFEEMFKQLNALLPKK